MEYVTINFLFWVNDDGIMVCHEVIEIDHFQRTKDPSPFPR